MRNFLSIEEKTSVREFLIHDLANLGLRIDSSKHRNILGGQHASPHLSSHSKQPQTSRVFNVPLHQMDTITVRLDEFDLTVPIFLRWCFDQIRRSIKHEGLFRKSGGSQRIKELMARIDDGSLAPSLSSSNTVFDVCSLFKEFLRRLTYPLISHPLQDLLLDCFSMRQYPSEKKIEMYLNILLLLPDEHLHALIYILRFLHEITLHERENKMNAKNLAICVGPGLMRAHIDGKGSLMTEQCATNVSDIVEALILHASELGYVTESIYERSQMLIEMRQKECLASTDESFALENGGKHGLSTGKFVDPANAKKRRSGSVKEFLVHMTNRFRRRSGSNNDSRDHTNAFLDQTGKLSSSHTREHRYHYQYYQQNSISEQCLSPSSSTSTTTTKRKSSDDPNGSSSKRGKTKTSSQEKSALPNSNRFTSPLTAFRRKKKTPCHSNDPGFPFKIEHSHLPQMLHFTDEVPARFSNHLVNPSSLSVSSSSLSSKGAAGSLTTSVIGHGDAHQTSLILPSDPTNPLTTTMTNNNNNKSLDAKKLNLLDSWKWPKSSRKAERKPLVAIHAPMLIPSAIDSSSLGELCPSPIKSTDDSIQTITQQIGSSSLLMHSSFGVHRHHSEEITSQSFSTGTTATCRPRRSISSSSGQAQTRHILCPITTFAHPEPKEDPQQVKDESYDDEDVEENADELNLAVVLGNEDAQSLRAETNDPLHQENGSLDVAFIDEADLAHQQSADEPMNTTENCLDKPEDPQQTSAMMVSVLAEKSMNQDDELDDILRRNANRAIRLTDSDDEDTENILISTHRTTPKEEVPWNEKKSSSTTPKFPVRQCSSISNLIACDSISDLPSNKSMEKERLFSSSLSHTLHDLLPQSSQEHDENTSLLNGGRKSILVLKDTLAGRVSRQVRAIEQRSVEQVQNRSIAPSISNDRIQASFPTSHIHTPEQRLIEEALTRGKKLVHSSIGTGDSSRSVKRLQNTPIRRWKERASELEERRRHSSSSPFRFINKQKKTKKI